MVRERAMEFFHRRVYLVLCGLMLLGLASCGGSLDGGGNKPVSRLVLNQSYSDGGITVTVTRYEAPVDASTTPISLDNRLSGFHVVLIACSLTNTGSGDLDVETRLTSSTSGDNIGKLVDVPPAAINGQDMQGKAAAALDAADLVRSGATVRRNGSAHELLSDRPGPDGDGVLPQHLDAWHIWPQQSVTAVHREHSSAVTANRAC